jgi:hypothetical protein
MEEVAKAAPTAGVSTLDLHHASLAQSLRALGNRSDALVAYLESVVAAQAAAAVAGGSGAKVDQRLLRSVASICHQLPAVDQGELEAAFMEVGDKRRQRLFSQGPHVRSWVLCV